MLATPKFGAALLALATFAPHAEAASSYKDRPIIPPIGARIEHYLPVPEDAKGPAVDPAKGYRLQQLGKGLYLITDNAYQSMFMVYETGVIVVDAPPGYAGHILQAVREVSDQPITHLIYSHSHTRTSPAISVSAHRHRKR